MYPRVKLDNSHLMVYGPKGSLVLLKKNSQMLNVFEYVHMSNSAKQLEFYSSVCQFSS